MAQRGSDGDKLNPSHISSSRGPLGLDTRHHHNHHNHHHQSSQQHNLDDDDKLLDVVGPPQSPLLSLGQSIQQMHPHAHAGKFGKNIFENYKFLTIFLSYRMVQLWQ